MCLEFSVEDLFFLDVVPPTGIWKIKAGVEVEGRWMMEERQRLISIIVFDLLSHLTNTYSDDWDLTNALRKRPTGALALQGVMLL